MEQSLNDDNERALLSKLLTDDSLDFDLTEDDFESELGKKAITIINDLKAKNQELNIIKIAHLMGDTKEVRDYLFNLPNYSYGIPAEHLYNELIERSKRKKATNLFINEVNKMSSAGEDVSQSIQDTIRELSNIDKRGIKQKTFTGQIVDTMEEIQDDYNNRGDIKLYTGIIPLDQLILGFHKKEYTIIGARPSVGKTTLALQFAYNIAKRGGKVMYVSLEMGASQLIKKLISMITNINGYIFRAGTLEEAHWDKIAQATSELSELKLVIPDDTYNLQDLVSKIKKEYNANGLDIVFIDYLQLLKSRNKTQSREQEVAEISRTLKLLSLQLNIPVVALCQLNRLSASGNNEPTMAELRESGSLEQDADNVFLLYSSPNADQKLDDPMLNVTLKIAKQRNGAWGKVNLLFQKQYSCFKAIN